MYYFYKNSLNEHQIVVFSLNEYCVFLLLLYLNNVLYAFDYWEDNFNIPKIP